MEIQVGELIKKAKVSRCGNGDYPVLSMTMHDGLMFQNDRFKKQIASVDQSNYQVVKRHQLVESFPIDEGVLAVQELTEEGIVSPAYKIWDVNMDRVIPVYLELALRSPRSIEYYKSKLRGTTARRRSITDAEFCAMQIKLPDLKEQERIIKLISRARAVSAKRQQELDTLDELIKARFVEMFGDARENPKGFSTVPFIDVVEYMGDIGSNGANKVVVDHLDMKDEEDYAMMVRFTNFTKNDFVDDVKYVSKEAYDFFKKSQIFGGELIICKIGSAGQNYVMPYLNRPVSLGLNQIMVRIKDNILMSYLYQYLHTEYGEFLIAGCINGAVTKTITKTELKKIPVMMPPMELQKQFADFVKQVDKSKVVVQKALNETQTLFDSLMQEYFG